MLVLVVTETVSLLVSPVLAIRFSVVQVKCHYNYSLLAHGVAYVWVTD